MKFTALKLHLRSSLTAALLLCAALTNIAFAANTKANNEAAIKPQSALLQSANRSPNAPIAKIRVGTGFGVNQFRGFNTNAATQYFIDGEAITGEPSPTQMGLGTRVNARLDGTANGPVTEGNATDVFIENALIGPVSTITPQLRVFGQPLTVSSDTVLVNFTAVNTLQVGDLLQVGGQIDANNSFVATRIERKNNLNNWRLTGFLTSINIAASTAVIGTQNISFVGITPTNCPTPIAAGQYVEVRATPITPFVPNQLINSVTRLRCGTPSIPGTVGAPGAVDGLISLVTPEPATEFKVNNLTVTYGPVTFFRDGNAEDIDLGVRVEVEGIYANATTISASKIRFIRPSLRFQANLLPADIIPNVSISVFGKLIKFTPQTRDEDGIAANGLSGPAAVEVRAYADSAGNLFATRVKDRGNIRPDNFRLTGPAASIVALTSFKILDVNVNTSASLFFGTTGLPITAATFYADLTPNRIVEISDALYNPATNTLSGGEVSFEDDVFDNRSGLLFKAIDNATVSGTLTEVALDGVFASGFED